MTGCKVTLTFNIRIGRAWKRPLCGQPVVARGLCEKHFADRIRLGGK